MALYTRFLFMLAIGLSGLTVVLMILMEGLFREWDMIADLLLFCERLSEGHYLAKPPRPEEDQAKSGRAEEPSRYLKRQKELGEIEAVETRLRGAHGPIVLTPLPRPSVLVPPVS